MGRRFFLKLQNVESEKWWCAYRLTEILHNWVASALDRGDISDQTGLAFDRSRSNLHDL